MQRIMPLIIAVLAPLCTEAQQPPQPAPPTARRPAGDAVDRLPIKRVVLYKNGVGYFEHLGTIRGNQNVTVSFTSGQLNDVLKTLTILDLSGGRVTGVSYGSAAPVDRQLGQLRIPVSEKPSTAEFLGAMRGARIEVHSGTSSITGRLLSVERKTRIAGGTTLEVDYLSLITDAGELRTAELTPSISVRLLDRGLPGQIQRFLDAVSAEREPDVRGMSIATEGSGERSLFVSYVSEVPVWKATYRIVLDSKAQGPLLQGWAIVDNTVGQDWENVDLSLVAGAPQSFIQNLSQPFYSRRPIVPLRESLNASPQTYEATLSMGNARLIGAVLDPTGASIAGATVNVYDEMGALLGRTLTGPAGMFDFRSLPDGAVRLEVDSPGFRRFSVSGITVSSSTPARQDVRLQLGSITETVEVTASDPPVQTSTSSRTKRSLGSGSMLRGSAGPMNSPPPPPSPALSAQNIAIARAESQTSARAEEADDLFEYKISKPITIRKNQSALVPIIQARIRGEKVSLWNDQAGLPRPVRALWIVNSTNLTLDGGAFSVLEDETFAGEGIFDAIRAGERRLVSYATDLALNVSSNHSTERERISRVRISNGIMIQESEERDKKTYTFRNEDTKPRMAVVEHPARAGYALRGSAQPFETTAGWMRFRLPVEPKQTASLVVEEAKPILTSYAVSDLTGGQLDVFVRQQAMDKSIEDALRRVVAQKNVIAALEEQESRRDSEMESMFDDQERLRENMKALKGSAEEKALVQRYTQQLNDQETRLAAIKTEKAQLEARLQSEKATLKRMIEEVSFDVKL